MESTSLELKVMSYVEDDGKKNRKPKILQQQTTERDSAGGRNPEWNHLMKFDVGGLPLKSGRLNVKFNIRAESLISGSKTIGEVCVPLNNLIEESNGAEAARYVMYQIRTLHSRPNGAITFRYKVTGNGKNSNEDDTKVTNSSQGFEFSSEKIKYPKVEKTICYPVVDDPYDSLQGRSFPSHKLYYRSLELHDQIIQLSSPQPTCYASPPPSYLATPPAYFQSLPPSPYHRAAPPSPYHAMASNYAMCGGYAGV